MTSFEQHCQDALAKIAHAKRSGNLEDIAQAEAELAAVLRGQLKPEPVDYKQAQSGEKA